MLGLTRDNEKLMNAAKFRTGSIDELKFGSISAMKNETQMMVEKMVFQPRNQSIMILMRFFSWDCFVKSFPLLVFAF